MAEQMPIEMIRSGPGDEAQDVAHQVFRLSRGAALGALGAMSGFDGGSRARDDPFLFVERILDSREADDRWESSANQLPDYAPSWRR
jgi:hypothetical protein